ncbi:MAG: recombinase family protein [Candidatus Kerfeldbacteria bacterium]|nr:recombinase family protein [Candidatus Kerfeldbacteria bacterium]
MPVNVIYARKSTESEDKQVLSIDSQIQELKLLALKRGLTIAEVLTESKSAKEPGRAIFGTLMRRIHRREIAGVLCWKMDRLARNHFDTGQVLQALADGKLPMVITSDRTYTADGNDRFLGNFELGMATKYIDDLRQNVKRGNRARFQRGWPNFRPPHGYIEDPKTKTVIRDPERWDLVKKMWDELISGRMRPVQILQAAKDDWGFRTRKTRRTGGRPLSASQLYRLFANPFYSGKIQLTSGESYRGSHERMITADQFERAQKIIGRPGKARPAKHAFTYAGLLRCGRCGCILTPEAHVKPSGNRYVYYRCHGPSRFKPCREPALPEATLESKILAQLQEMAIDQEAAEWFEDTVGPEIKANADQLRTAHQSLEKSVQAAGSELESLLNLRLRGQVDDATYDRKRLELIDRQTVLRLKLEQPEPSGDELISRLEKVLEFSLTAPFVFAKAGPVQRRLIVEATTSNWTVKDREPLCLAKNPFSILAAATSRPTWWVTRIENWKEGQGSQRETPCV